MHKLVLTINKQWKTTVYAVQFRGPFAFDRLDRLLSSRPNCNISKIDFKNQNGFRAILNQKIFRILDFSKKFWFGLFSQNEVKIREKKRKKVKWKEKDYWKQFLRKIKVRFDHYENNVT